MSGDRLEQLAEAAGIAIEWTAYDGKRQRVSPEALRNLLKAIELPADSDDEIDSSLRNLDVDVLDLVQLHCPPTDAYYHPELFERMERLVERGKLRHYGVSVERVEEGLKAIEYPGVASVQIIYNMFRLRPAELFFRQAQRRNVARAIHCTAQ